MLAIVGLVLGILGLIGTIVVLIRSVAYMRRHSPYLPASLLIGFMVSQIFFDLGLAFYLGYIYAKLG